MKLDQICTVIFLVGSIALAMDGAVLAQSRPTGSLQFAGAIGTRDVEAFAIPGGKTPTRLLRPAELTFPLDVLESSDGMARIRVEGKDYWVDASAFKTRLAVGPGVGCLTSSTKVPGGTERGANEPCPQKK